VKLWDPIKNIQILSLSEALNTLNSITSVKYNYKGDSQDAMTSLGIANIESPNLAQNNLVRLTTVKDLSVILSKVIQYQREKILELKVATNALNKKVVKLNNQINELNSKILIQQEVIQINQIKISENKNELFGDKRLIINNQNSIAALQREVADLRREIQNLRMQIRR